MENPDRGEVGKGSVATLNGTPDSDAVPAMNMNADKGSCQPEASCQAQAEKTGAEGMGSGEPNKTKTGSGENADGGEEGLFSIFELNVPTLLYPAFCSMNLP